MPSLTKVQSGFIEAQGALPLSSGTAAAPGLKFDDSTGTGMFSPSTGVIGFSTGNAQSALTIGSDGQLGIGGANYGTSGQVITSNGSGSAPTWQDTSGGGGGGETDILEVMLFT